MLPKTFQNQPDAIASYDYVDIASGTGIVNFYAGNAASGSFLANYKWYSDTICSLPGTPTNPISAVLDLDFDVLINKPFDIRGLSLVSVPLHTIGGEGVNTVYVKAKIRKWDGTTETEIASNTSRTLTVAISANIYQNLTIDINVPITHFKPGEYLRLTIEVWALGAAPGSETIGHDPMARLSGSAYWNTTGMTDIPSSLIFYVPRIIDI